MKKYGCMGPKEGTQNRFKVYFKLSLIAVILVLIFGLFYACQEKEKTPLDFDDVDLIQYQVPDDDAPVVVFETSLGTFKSVLYPDEAPEYCEYFTKLVKDGYYDGTHISMVKDGVYFIGGTKQADGAVTSDTDKTEIKAEQLSKNLWPFKGALCAYTYENGFWFWKHKVSNSYLLFVNNYELTDEEKAELDGYLEEGSVNEDVTNAYKEHGGVLNFSQQHTVFGQTYDGMDVYEKICGYDVQNEEEDNLQPVDEIIFKKVYMSTYGENKKDEAFSNEKASSDSSVPESSNEE